MTEHVPFFLRADATLDALDSLSAAEDLVIYCGAGVTIDRTGLSWSGLLREILRQGKLRDRQNREDKHAAIEYLRSNLKDEEQIASIITEYFTDHHPSKTNDWLTLQLQQVLYVENGWSEGKLLQNLAKLAVIAGPRLNSLTILTTNYDVYLEEQLQRTIKEVRAHAGAGVQLPGLERLVSPQLPSDEEWAVVPMVEPTGTEMMIRLVYLHGRVGKVGNPTEGTIVLDELSFAKSRNAVFQQLVSHLDGKHAMTLGASVTDAPLIQALAATKTDDSHTTRFALIHPSVNFDPASAPTFTKGGNVGTLEIAQVEAALGYRGRHLGITQLYPMSHSQTAQFVEELELSLNLCAQGHPRSTYRAPEAGVNYESRLARWSAEFLDLPPDPHGDYTHVLTALEVIKTILEGTDEENSALRLELWLRAKPSSKNRTLTLHANSAGPLVGTGPVRTETLDPRAPNASVHAFLGGRPGLMSLVDLGFDATTVSRWKEFLAVPVSVQIAHEIGDESYTASVPVGVITLTGLQSARLKERVEALPVSTIRSIVEVMSVAALELLGRASPQRPELFDREPDLGVADRMR